MRASALTVCALVTSVAACGDPTPPPGPPKAIRPLTATVASWEAGSNFPDGVTVHVVDYRDRDVAGARVEFSVTQGDGTVSPQVVVTDGSGVAHAEWRLGRTAGPNEVIARIEGIDSSATFSVLGNPAPSTALVSNPRTLRVAPTASSAQISATLVDGFGNAVAGTGITYETRDPGLVTVNGTTGAMTVVARGGTTYIIARSGNAADSTLVVLLQPGDPPCIGIPARAALAVGEVMTTGFSDNSVCVAAVPAGAEYALVPYYDSSVPSATTVVAVSGFGVVNPGPLNSAERSMSAATAPSGGSDTRDAHRRLRELERREMPSRVESARQWYAADVAAASPRMANRKAVVPAVGSLVQLNANMLEFCANPLLRTGRVAAVTDWSIVVADTANPVAITDTELEHIGRTFDSVAYPVAVANFGLPTDVDRNGGRLILFFTHALNEQLGQGTLGAFFQRDLLPRIGPLGTCSGSNGAEIAYLAAPDAFTSKSFVLSTSVGTAVHEFQHAINGSRRLYFNRRAATSEEVWLNEGLSHVAEELAFYRAAGLAPRMNLGGEVLVTRPQAWLDYMSLNIGRFRQYISSLETETAVELADVEAGTASRGATWSLLRYAADHRAASNEASFWRKLVNSNATGMENLTEAVGPDARQVIRDWALSVVVDDLVPTLPAYQQPSWNLRSVMSGYFPATRLLADGLTSNYLLQAGGNLVARFGVAPGREAYVRASGGNGTALSRQVLLALVRTK